MTGATPLEIPYFRFRPTQVDLDAVSAVLASGWLTTGQVTLEFERSFAQLVGARHALAVSSCTAALHLAYEAAGVGPKHAVLVPTLTFTATAEAARYLGAEVVLADVDATSGLLTVATITRALERCGDVRTIVPVHFGGRAASIRGSAREPCIAEFASSRGISVIEDAAHAFPSRDGDHTVGSMGLATCFSFYANKTLPIGEGGMITTNDDELAARMRLMRLHGINRDSWERFTAAPDAWEYDVVAPGYKYNLPDVAAALGLSQLQRATMDHLRRLELATRYDAAFAERCGLDRCPLGLDPAANAWHLYWIRLRGGSEARPDFIKALARAGIGTSVHYRPLHRMSYWKARYSLHPAQFPGAETFFDGCVSLPIYPSLTNAEQDRVIAAVLDHTKAS